VFRTRCDTEAIVHLYEEEGARCVESLQGMFAFAIWDQNREELFLARDRLGIKPLYYAPTDGRLAFGSEIKAVLAAPGVPTELNFEALLDYLTFLYVPHPKSIYRGIFKLPPAHTATLSRKGLHLREYWKLTHPVPAEHSLEQWTELFRDELQGAVRSHLMSDVPLGAFLSGGLDSSAVVAAMAQIGPKPPITNSIGFAEQPFDERPFADKVAARFQAQHHSHTVTADAADVVNRLAWHYDEPFADSSAVPTYYVSELTRRNVKVALSGDGGDENMAGYRKHKLHHRERMVRRWLSPETRSAMFNTLARMYPKADWLPRPLRAKSTFQNLALSDVEAIYLSRAAYDPAIARGLLAGDVRAELRDYDPFYVIEEPYRRCESRDAINRELYVDIKTYLVDDILTKVDRASMAVGLEVRVPLLDHRFVEFAAGIPGHWKLRGGQGKYLFKESVRSWLGTDIVDRPKLGFCIPLDKWLSGPLRDMVEGTVFSSDARVGAWLDTKRLAGLWEKHLRGTRSSGGLIWAVFMLEQWARTFYAGRGTGFSSPTPTRRAVACV
jgi:asparagine synthase (glutamine-hydrolysing)